MRESALQVWALRSGRGQRARSRVCTISPSTVRSQIGPLVTARQIGMYVFRELTDYSYPQIAREFGGRDHTTVMHAVEKITDQMAERRHIYEQVSELINRIKSGESA